MKNAVEGCFEAVARGDRHALFAPVTPDLRWVVPKGAIEPYADLGEGARLQPVTL